MLVVNKARNKAAGSPKRKGLHSWELSIILSLAAKGDDTVTMLKVTMTTTNAPGFPAPLEPDTWETTAAQFIDDNDFDGDEVIDLGIFEMNVGDSFVYGGGSAPEFLIERVA